MAVPDNFLDVRGLNSDPPILPFVQPQEEAFGEAEERHGPEGGVWDWSISREAYIAMLWIEEE